MDTDKFGIYSKGDKMRVLVLQKITKIYILSPKNAIDLYKSI